MVLHNDFLILWITFVYTIVQNWFDKFFVYRKFALFYD